MSTIKETSKGGLVAVEIQRTKWNIKDATEALICSVSMSNWDNVIKYASQLKVLETQLYRLESEQSSAMFFGR